MFFRLGIVFFLAAAWLVSRVEAKDPARFREVRVQLLGIDGKPAAGREVFLMGLTRFGGGDAKDDGWHFKSDAEGRFVVQMGEFASVDKRSPLPGWGEYALVANPGAEDAGALSDFIVHSPDSPKESAKESRDWGPTKITGKNGLNLTMRVREGVTLHGRIVDYLHPERVLAGVDVDVSVDLQANTHTGYGGEVLERAATTDAEGRFTISHIYPAPFDISLRGKKLIWLETQRGGKWVKDAVDTIVPGRGVGAYELIIMAADRPLFRYSGKVTDRAGKPVVGASVSFGVSFHRVTPNYADDHHFEATLTTPDGRFEILLSTPWVRGMNVQKEGFVRKDRWDEDDGTPFGPGIYNFTLQPAP